MQKKKDTRQRYQLISHQKSKSPIFEQYRNIRTNTEFTVVDKNIQSLMVTSANPGEGKTTTAAYLAVVFFEQGKKVLLIDANLRKPTVHIIFQIDNIFGLTNVLTHNEQLGNCIQKTSVNNLHCLPCGSIPPNPADLLGSEAMHELLNSTCSMYDLVILDLPSILAVTDARIIANQCNASLIVIRSGMTIREDVMKATELFKKTDEKFLGVILNDCVPKGFNHYYGSTE
ncbi:CpsD/CapB family tyrosine-protein kinase [Bacillus cereus]|uniref:CpsD/CapB family tyrosine-protein kinase n=1 Tax=Bacillus cereus TaxID=1396 RepID=UPI002AC0D288|nr:CpsD/CapB family tyrosine-protein kinase [Bacillus cereus]MDZ4417108.1 CpsD/CapB family tyrosine-protein kinase [Bacillus cereus]